MPRVWAFFASLNISSLTARRLHLASMKAMKYARLLPFELERELARKPVAYVPWGALEWHGEHMALGQDALKVEKICDMTAAKTGGVVLPLLFIGYHTMQLHGMPYTLEFSRDLVKATFLELAKQLELASFKVIVVLCGHYGRSHLAAIAEAAEEYSKTGRAKVLALPEYALVEIWAITATTRLNGRPRYSRASTLSS